MASFVYSDRSAVLVWSQKWKSWGTSENFIFSKGIDTIAKNRPVILYENKDICGDLLYNNVVNCYPDYEEESLFDIKKYCIETLGYSGFIDGFNNGIDTLLIP